MEFTDKGFLELLRQGNELAFEKVFTTYYEALHAYAFIILGDGAIAEELVQEVFFSVWAKKDKLDIRSSLKSYLYKSVFNECMDHLKHRKHKAIHTSYVLHQARISSSGEDADRRAGLKDLEKKLQKALNDLPEQCRIIFQLSRFEGAKYQEIAAQLGLSVKTVEAQMGKALRRLRISLAEFLPLLIFFLWPY
ncbi:MAG TPA: RNA polymerase sigma-70 factor [Puia sp.]|nr:RNA polymerase sigma-70 factor [Puia sp.]